MSEREALFAMLADGEHPLELRYRNRHGGGPYKTFAHTPEEADRRASALVAAGYDTYHGFAPRLSDRGDDQCRYAPAHALVVDLDCARAVRKAELFEPSPTVIVESGGLDGRVSKEHLYFGLARPVAPEEAKRHMRRLAHHLEGCMGSTDAAHIFRTPGSRHPGTGRVARLLEFTGELVDLEELTGDLPDAPANATTAAARSAAQASGGQVPVHHRHNYLFPMACSMRGRGLSEEWILAELRRVNETECRPPLGDREVTYLVHDVVKRYVPDREKRAG